MSKKLPVPPDFDVSLPVAESARVHGVSPPTVRKWIKASGDDLPLPARKAPRGIPSDFDPGRRLVDNARRYGVCTHKIRQWMDDVGARRRKCGVLKPAPRKKERTFLKKPCPDGLPTDWTGGQVARHYGVATKTALRWLRESGAQVRKKNGDAELRQSPPGFDPKISVPKAMEKYSVGEDLIRRWRREAGYIGQMPGSRTRRSELLTRQAIELAELDD